MITTSFKFIATMEHLKILEVVFEYNGQQQTICPVILKDEHETILVDCGYPGFMGLIEKAADKHGILLGELTGVIITHHDIDHVGGLFEIKEKYPAVKVYASELTAKYTSGIEKSARLVQAERLHASVPEDQKDWALSFQQMLENIRLVNVNHIFDENEILPFCGGIEIISTPGHMPGHIALYLEGSKTLIAADTLVYDKGSLILANPQFAIDLDEAVNSVKKLLNYDIERIVCYHGGLVEKDIDKKLNDLMVQYE